MILIASHPAPVVRIPVRMRKMRLDWERMRTAIEIQEISASETEKADPILLKGRDNHDGLVPVIHDGRLYSPFWCDDVPGTASELATVVENGAGHYHGPWDRLSSIRMQLAGTPFSMPYRRLDRYGHPKRDDRGDVLGPDNVLKSHGGQRAVAAMKDYVRTGLILIDGVPHHRVVPLATIRAKFLSRVGAIEPTRVFEGIDTMPFEPRDYGRIREVPRIMVPDWDAFEATDAFKAWIGLPDSVFADWTARLVANGLPHHLRYHTHGGWNWEAAHPDKVVGMDDIRMHALANLVSGDHVEHALEACADQLRDILQDDPYEGDSRREAALHMVERLYLRGEAPRAGDIASDDLAALDVVGRETPVESALAMLARELEGQAATSSDDHGADEVVARLVEALAKMARDRQDLGILTEALECLRRGPAPTP